MGRCSLLLSFLRKAMVGMTKMQNYRQTNCGYLAEQFFIECLEAHNWQILVYNWRAKADGAGQVDVIAKKEKVVLFEVKYRSCQYELDCPLTKQQIIRLYRAGQNWNSVQANLKISEYYLALIRPLPKQKDNNFSAIGEFNFDLVCASKIWRGHQLQFFKFGDILE